jgi:hypothetical protein
MGMCRELHCLPSQIMAEDVSILRLMAIETMGRADGE